MTLAPLAAIRGAVATVSLLGLTGVATVGMASAALSETMQPPVHPVVADMQTCSGDGCLASSTLEKRTRATGSHAFIQQRVVGQKADLGWENDGELEADFEDGTLEELEADFEDGTSGRSEEFLETVNTDVEALAEKVVGHNPKDYDVAEGLNFFVACVDSITQDCKRTTCANTNPRSLARCMDKCLHQHNCRGGCIHDTIREKCHRPCLRKHRGHAKTRCDKSCYDEVIGAIWDHEQKEKEAKLQRERSRRECVASCRRARVNVRECMRSCFQQ